MTLIEFAKQLPEDHTEQEFVDLMNQVIDMKSIKDLLESERSALFSGVQYLADFILLAQEAKGEISTSEGSPLIQYNGPFIPNILQRPGDAAADFAALENFGVGEADKFFGNDEA